MGASSLMFVNFEDALPNRHVALPTKGGSLYESFATLEFFQEFFFRLYKARKLLVPRTYSNSEIIEYALKTTKTKSPYTDILKEVIRDTKADDRFIVNMGVYEQNPNPYFSAQYDIAMRFIRDMRGLLGFSNEIIIDYLPNVVSDDYWESRYEPREDQIAETVSGPELRDILMREDFYNWFQPIILQGIVKRIKIPVKITNVEYVSEFTHVVPIDYKYQDVTQWWTVKLLPKYGVERDVFFKRFSNQLAMVSPPRWHFSASEVSYIKTSTARLINMLYGMSVFIRDKFQEYNIYEMVSRND
jgi:hypothetical protein